MITDQFDGSTWHGRFWHAAADRRATETAERIELLARCGDLDTVLAPTPIETALVEAVRPWAVWCRPPDDPRRIESIDGCVLYQNLDTVPWRVKDSIASAHPLPATIAEARDEHLMWECRERERGLAISDTSCAQLDLPAHFRQEMVERLLEIGLRAASLEDALVRQRHAVGLGYYDGVSRGRSCWTSRRSPHGARRTASGSTPRRYLP